MTVTLTRRSFLHVLGVSAAAGTLTHMGITLAESPAPQIGRTLRLAKVFPYPDGISHSHILPDQIVTIHSASESWYQIPQGYVPRGDIQPMQPFAPHPFHPFIAPYWAEVVGPIATVRIYCAADAPLVTRIGHGGVVQIVDALPGEPHGWYQLADQDGAVLGWSQAPAWQPIHPLQSSSQPGTSPHTAQIESFNSSYSPRPEGEGQGVRALISTYSAETQVRIHREGWLTVHPPQAEEVHIPFSAGVTVQPGAYTVDHQQIGGGYAAEQRLAGVGWQTRFGADYRIVGAYWHNAFGTPQPGAAVQLPPLLARWVYHLLPSGVTVTVV
jgi:hypothetical protein